MNDTQVFEVKLRFTQVNDEGKERRVTKAILIRAANFTDAEAKGYEYLQQHLFADSSVIGIKPSRLKRFSLSDEHETYFNVKAKLSYVNDAGNEKSLTESILVQTSDSTAAIQEVEKMFDGERIQVVSVTKSRLFDAIV